MKIALYFAYLGHYTVALCFPTVLGIIFWFIQGENQVAQFIYSLKIDLYSMAHHSPTSGVSISMCYALLKMLLIKSSKRKMAMDNLFVEASTQL